MSPACLHHAHLLVVEVGQSAPQEVGLGNEVRIEDADELARGGGQAPVEGTRLEPVAAAAAQMGRIQTALLQRLHPAPDRLRRVVIRIVQNLDLDSIRRIVQPGHGTEQTLDDIKFVVNRQLNGDYRPPLHHTSTNRGRGARAQVQDDEVEAVDSEDAEQTQRDRVGEEGELSVHTPAPLRGLLPAGIAVLAGSIGALAWLGDLRQSPYAAITLMMVAFLGFLLACAGLARRPSGRRPMIVLIVGLAVSLRLVMLLAPPSLSDDVYRYRWDGRVQADGRNPYEAPPADSRLESLRDSDWSRINYPEIRTIYPPLTQVLFAATYGLHGSLKAFQVAAVAGDILLIALLALLIQACSKPAWWLALYALHPLPIVEFAGSGHFDAWAMAAVVGAILLHVRGRAALSTLALAAGILLKTWPFVMAPLFLRHRPRWHLALLTAPVAGLYAVYFDPGMLQPWLDYAGRWRFNDGIFWLLHAATDSLPAAKAVAAGLGGLLFLWLWRQNIDPVRGGYWLLLGFILLMPTVHPWYLLWALPLAALAFDLGWIVLCGLAPLAYAILANAAADSNTWIEPTWPRFVIYGAGLALWLAQTAIDLKPPAPGAPIPADRTKDADATRVD